MAETLLPPCFLGVIGVTAGGNSGFSLGHGCFAKAVQPSVSLNWCKMLILGYFRLVFNIKIRAGSSQIEIYFLKKNFPPDKMADTFSKVKVVLEFK